MKVLICRLNRYNFNDMQWFYKEVDYLRNVYLGKDSALVFGADMRFSVFPISDDVFSLICF